MTTRSEPPSSNHYLYFEDPHPSEILLNIKWTHWPSFALQCGLVVAGYLLPYVLFCLGQSVAFRLGFFQSDILTQFVRILFQECYEICSIFFGLDAVVDRYAAFVPHEDIGRVSHEPEQVYR